MKIHADSRNIYVEYTKNNTKTKNKNESKQNFILLPSQLSKKNKQNLDELPAVDVIAQFFDRQNTKLTHNILDRYVNTNKNIDYSKESLDVSLNDVDKLQKLLKDELSQEN